LKETDTYVRSGRRPGAPDHEAVALAVPVGVYLRNSLRRLTRGFRVRMLGRVAVQRSRFPVAHSSDRARQGFSQSLGRVPGTTHRELDLFVDLASQTPGMILRPHEVRFLGDAIAAYPMAAVVYETRVASAERTVSTGSPPDRTTSASECWGNSMRTYTS
jgi:hypothetical protein